MSQPSLTPVEIALLCRIAREALPYVLTDEEDFEVAAALTDAGCVISVMQLIPSQRSILPCLAFLVSEITSSGWAVLSLDSPHTASASSVA